MLYKTKAADAQPNRTSALIFNIRESEYRQPMD